MTSAFRSRAEREAIAAEAARWIVRLADNSDPVEQAEAEAWIASDPAHAVAYIEAEEIWAAAGRVRTRQTLIAEEPDEAGEPDQSLEVAPLSRRSMVGLLTACAATALGVVTVWPTSMNVLATEHRQRRRERLMDGTSISMNVDTRLEVSVTPHRRLVRMLGGEALFDVERDPTRPFVVEFGRASVRVLGTSFNLRRSGDGTELVVSEGSVLVTGTDNAKARVDAGMAAMIRPGILTVAAVDDALLRQRLAWNEGFIELDGESLDQAVNEVNRYRDQPIIIGDPKIAKTRIAGRFGIDESDSFIEALEGSFDIRAVRSRSGEIVLLGRDDRFVDSRT